MAKRKSGPRTIYDVLEGKIPIKCRTCGHTGYFDGKKEYRPYFNCDGCGHAVVLSGGAMTDAKNEYTEEIMRRSRAWQ
jgi:hypothetical protein